MAGFPRRGRGNGLVAVLLITRSRPGPKLVFHYPPIPDGHGCDQKVEVAANDDSTSEEDQEDSTRHEWGVNESKAPRRSNGVSSIDVIIEESPSSLFGYSVEVLERLLSPGRWSDRRKFEICLDGLTFVAYPIYAHEDGTWSNEAAAKSNGTSNKRPITHGSHEDGAISRFDDTAATSATNLVVIEPETSAKAIHDFRHIPESLDSQSGRSLATSMNSTSTASGVAIEQMTMFSVVFVLAENTSPDSLTPSDVHHRVAKPLSKAMLYCQEQTSYVSTESRRLLALKTKAMRERTAIGPLWRDLVDNSELAWALKEVYDKLSSNEIAGIRVNGIEMSLLLYRNRYEEKSKAPLKPGSALLLLEDKAALLREIAHLDASPLAHFIREHTPTKTLQKQATKLNMPVNDIKCLATHLIKWRKARAIPPLHPRNVYIVAADAPLDSLSKHSQDYARRFPTLPSLSTMLGLLSAQPVKYGMLIPSTDHSAPYMEILAYLVRYGFAVQSKTFGWFRTLHDLESEKFGAGPSPFGLMKHQPKTGVSLLSPHLRAADDDDASVSSDRTAIPLTSHSLFANQADSSDPNQNRAREPSPQERDGHLITANPAERSLEESGYLDQIRDMLIDDEFHASFYSFACYMDGKHAFEEIAYQMGLKRAKVEGWLDFLNRRGLLLTVQYV